MANQLFADFAYDDAGVAIVGATVNLYDRNTTTPVRATTTTDANGYWSISHATEGRFDSEVVSGTTKRRRKWDTRTQFDTLEVAALRVRNPAFTFDYDLVPAAITADRQLNWPLITATDTLAVLGLAQTFTAGTASTSTTTGTVVVTGGVGISGSVYAGGSMTFGTQGTAGARITLLGTNPGFFWNEGDAAADNRLWDLGATGEQLVGRILNDAESAAQNWIAVDRTGAVVDSITFPNGGIVVGAPTGGNKGTGTVNAVGVYDDNVLLTDFVFEDGYYLPGISEMSDFFRREKRLPTIPGRAEWEKNGSFSVGQLATRLWETVEAQAIYISQLHERLRVLEVA